MEWQSVINLAAGGAMMCLGWFLRTVFDATQCLKRSVHELEVDIASNYLKKDEVREMLSKIDHRFDKMEMLVERLFDKLDTKQDKAH